tara:strand:- start:500 stop:2230 length:1731 start_codon:yes stop_codon:yes gene_type:complete
VCLRKVFILDIDVSHSAPQALSVEARVIQHNYDNLSRVIRSAHGFNSKESAPSLSVLLSLLSSRDDFRKGDKSPFLFSANEGEEDDTEPSIFLWDGSDIFLMSAKNNGQGTYSQSRRLLKCPDLSISDACFEFYNFLFPIDFEDNKRLLRDYSLSQEHGEQLELFSQPRVLEICRSGDSAERSFPALIERSSKGWLTLTFFLHNNFDESAHCLAVMQGLLCLLFLEQKRVDFGDLSANNLIIFPSACGQVPIDLSNIKPSSGVMELPEPISTFFDPELGPWYRCQQVDAFSLSINILFSSVHLIYDASIRQLVIDLGTFCQSGAVLRSGDYDHVQRLAGYSTKYDDLLNALKGKSNFPIILTVLLQLIHPNSLQRPSILDIFNRVEVVCLVIRSIKSMALVNYSLASNMRLVDDLMQLVSGSSLSPSGSQETEETDESTVQSLTSISGLVFLSLMVYSGNNTQTDPQAIQDQIRNLLALVKVVDANLLSIHDDLVLDYEARFPMLASLDAIFNEMISEIMKAVTLQALCEVGFESDANIPYRISVRNIFSSCASDVNKGDNNPNATASSSGAHYSR